MIVSDELFLEDVFEVLARAEGVLGRSVHPTLHTSEEYKRRRASQSPFLADVLASEQEVLLGALE